MLLTAKVSKSYFSFVYGDPRDGSVRFGQIYRQTYLSTVPLFKRVPQDCLLYFLKRQTHPAHPKHIKQYLSYLLSLHTAAVDFTCEQLVALFREFPQCVYDESLLEALIYALNVRDFGFSSAYLNVLRILRFAAAVEENRSFFARKKSAFFDALVLAVEEYRQRLVSLASVRAAAQREVAPANSDTKFARSLAKESMSGNAVYGNKAPVQQRTGEEINDFDAFLNNMGTGPLTAVSDSYPASQWSEVRYTATQAYEHQFYLFQRFELLNSAKIAILLELCTAFYLFEVDVPAVCARQRLEPEIAAMALDFLVEKSHFYPLSGEVSAWLLCMLRDGTLDSQLAVCRVLCNYISTQPEIYLDVQDALLGVYSAVYEEALKLLQTTEVSASHDYVYELGEAACMRLYGLLKAMEVVCTLCYRLHYELSCDKLLSLVVAAYQITYGIAIFLVSRRQQLKSFYHFYRLTQIVRRFSAATRNEYFDALLFCLTNEETTAPIEFRCVYWMRQQDSGEALANAVDTQLFREFAAQNYRRMDDVSTVCIDVAARLFDPGSLILQEMWRFWTEQSGQLAEFNVARMRAAGAWPSHANSQKQSTAVVYPSDAPNQEPEQDRTDTAVSPKIGKNKLKAKDTIQKAGKLGDNGRSLQPRAETSVPAGGHLTLAAAEEQNTGDFGAKADR